MSTLYACSRGNDDTGDRFIYHMKNTKTDNDILFRLTRIYGEFSGEHRINPDSQMCSFWRDLTVEILVGSEELDALEVEFGIKFEDHTALEIYDMSIGEAAAYITAMIVKQSKKTYDSDSIIDQLSPAKAKRVLRQIWEESHKGKGYITSAIENLDYLDKIEK